MKTFYSSTILEKYGLSIRTFKWQTFYGNETKEYLKFLNPNWNDISDFERELNQFPIKCLDNIICIEDDLISNAEMQQLVSQKMCERIRVESIRSIRPVQIHTIFYRSYGLEGSYRLIPKIVWIRSKDRMDFF